VLRKGLHLKAYKLPIVQHLERWIVHTPLNVNVFVTLATQQHLKYHYKVHNIVHLHIVISLSLSLFMVPSLCGLPMFKTLNSGFHTCHFIKIFKNTTCLGLNRPSSSVKMRLLRKLLILDIHAPSSLCLPCACNVYQYISFL
jgi:hypothetical protein